MTETRSTIVVTGFGPFGIHLKNASWEAVKLLPDMYVEQECDVQLVIEEIPVAYEDVNTIVPELWNTYQPLVILLFVQLHTTVISLYVYDLGSTLYSKNFSFQIYFKFVD